ncbi:MAG: hypothetical protein WAN36_01680 [Calditrichia bacterium]
MPNTLGHVGAQGPISRWLAGSAVSDIKWIYLGVLLPDIAWILHRILKIFYSGWNPFDLRLYAIVQSTLFFSLVLAAAISLLALRSRAVFLVLSGNALLHLLLDALQTKWGNGVHLFAPFSWKLINWGFFWPESFVTYFITAAGLIFIIFYWRKAANTFPEFRRPAFPRFTFAFLFLTAYFILPFLFFGAAEKSDSHSVQTLRLTDARTGKDVEMDRAEIKAAANGLVVQNFSRIKFRIKGKEIPPAGTVVSLKGRFIDEQTIRADQIHIHPGVLRDIPSYLGILLIFVIWLIAYLQKRLKEYRMKEKRTG